MKNKRISIVLFFAFIFELSNLIHPQQITAANLTVAKDTLQSSRMSFFGRVKSPTTAGSSHVWIYTVADANATSVSTAGLKPGDSLTIGETAGYIIDSIVDADEFTLTTNLAAGDADDGDVIYFKSKPQHVITFKTASAIDGGFFQVLIPAGVSSGNDTIPDITGFDYNTSAPTSIGTDVVPEYDFITGVATAAGGTGCTSPANYHCFTFHYYGTGAAGTDITLKIGNTNGTNTMVAPAPSASRVANTADAYTFKVRNFPNGSDPETASPTDDVTGKIAVIESVRVTATVDPSITFKIEGVADSVTACGLDLDVTTTNSSVPFGVLALNTFRSAAQKLTVSTNAISGYSVTAIENEKLSNLAASPTYIIDTLCDTGACSQTSSAAWATATGHPGFGYTVEIVNGTPTIAPVSPLFQHFPNKDTDAEAPFEIMSNATTADSQAAYVCYQLAVDATQPAGNYENQVTYTATASF